jgi:hypothetical protein
MNHTTKLTLVLAGSIAALFSTASSASAAIYHVQVNTAALIGNGSGPFSLDFQFNDGSGSNDGNNTASILNLNLGNGSASGSPFPSGGASGSLGSGVSLTDSSFFNDLYEAFTPGSGLSFDVSISGNTDLGGAPDLFSFAILDGNLANITTNGSGDTLFSAEIGGPAVYSSGTAAYATITAVPEPGFAMGAFALFGMIGADFFGRRRSRQAV